MGVAANGTAAAACGCGVTKNRWSAASATDPNISTKAAALMPRATWVRSNACVLVVDVERHVAELQLGRDGEFLGELRIVLGMERDFVRARRESEQQRCDQQSGGE